MSFFKLCKGWWRSWSTLEDVDCNLLFIFYLIIITIWKLKHGLKQIRVILSHHNTIISMHVRGIGDLKEDNVQGKKSTEAAKELHSDGRTGQVAHGIAPPAVEPRRHLQIWPSRDPHQPPLPNLHILSEDWRIITLQFTKQFLCWIQRYSASYHFQDQLRIHRNNKTIQHVE